MQTLYRENGNFLPESRKHEEEKRAMAERMMAQAMKQYKDVYFLNCNWTGNDHETTADGVHPSDLGYYRCAQTLTPKLRKILKKYHL